MSITPGQLANEMGADPDDVDILAGQLQDEDLYDPETGLLSPDGAAVVRDQLTYGSCAELLIQG